MVAPDLFFARRCLVAAAFIIVTVVVGATGISEYLVEAEVEIDEKVEGAIPEDTIAEEPAPQPENEAVEPPGLPFIPTVTYPDTLFLAVELRAMGSMQVQDFLAAIEADRRLLSELRKPVPDNRVAAEMFLNRLKRLAERADPVRLAIVAGRVLEQAPIYFDWLETEFESPQEEISEYYIGGAQGFSRAMKEFENMVLLTTINRLDTASRVIQAFYSAQTGLLSGNARPADE